jgi:hypothetical protein
MSDSSAGSGIPSTWMQKSRKDMGRCRKSAPLPRRPGSCSVPALRSWAEEPVNSRKSLRVRPWSHATFTPRCHCGTDVTSSRKMYHGPSGSG